MHNDNSKFKTEFYERLIKFSIRVIRLSSEIRENRNLYPLADQLIRSATSIGANVTEAKGSSSKREYIKYFEIALKSGYETQYWLIILDKCIDNEKIRIILNECVEICKIISSSVITMKNKREL